MAHLAAMDMPFSFSMWEFTGHGAKATKEPLIYLEALGLKPKVLLPPCVQSKSRETIQEFTSFTSDALCLYDHFSFGELPCDISLVNFVLGCSMYFCYCAW